MKGSPGIFRAASCASIVVSICTFLPSARAAGADTPAAGTSGPSQSASNPEPHGLLDEVVVTAQKRVENILTVPISITALSEATLEQHEIKDINDLSRIVPGLSLLPAGQST